MPPTIVLTLGEPAGIGPDIAVKVAQKPLPCKLAVIGDPDVLAERAKALRLPLRFSAWPNHEPNSGVINLIEERVSEVVVPGQPIRGNVAHVLSCLDRAIDGCLRGEFDAMVTGPAHKGIINDAGVHFTGHTEYIAERTGGRPPVMLLATNDMKVALVTTHVPLSAVSELITTEKLKSVLEVLIADMRQKFGIEDPKVAVCGLNPHAGEQGYLGSEELDVIEPVIDGFRLSGHSVAGPFPADTMFIPQNMGKYDVVLSMYHDQGLPVIKHHGFEEAVNITLGIPIIRTSVDHGTALELAGTGSIDTGSSLAAIELASTLAQVASLR